MRVGVVDGSVTTELRRSVLRPHWPVGSVMHGDAEPEAVHIAAVDGGAALCACVLFPRSYPLRPEVTEAWQLRGMATRPERRSQGLGAAVLATVAAELTARGAVLVWCEAREAAAEFYRRNGFVAEGERYLHSESGTPHFMMVRELCATATSSS
jgi:GNAT superfamily N-acetyltransferase